MITILSVDDDITNQFLISHILQKQGYKVTEAFDGFQAIAEYKKNYKKIDLILMDIMMPKMNGYDTTRTIKSDPALKGIPIIVITSYALSGDDQKAFDAGADDYMAKPYAPKDLLEKVEAWLGK